ncbi:MAG: transglycosylase SLT domain-containing protein [Pseudomonadota bacterium]
MTGALALTCLDGDTAKAVARGGGTPANATAGGAATTAASDEVPEPGCLARTICAIKDKIRWGTPAWTAPQCQKIANAVLSASRRHKISPSLLLAVMINESDMNEKAARISMKDGKLYAKDSGLMGIRCVLDKKNRCMNGNVRGLAWSYVMDPASNIDLGARELAFWKNGGAVTRTFVKSRDANGHGRTILKSVPCPHKDHAYWAHYNHGPHYISHGYPRHYPHRVAVVDHALANVMNLDAPELRGSPITIHDPGKRQRTPDHPLEPRYRKLCTQIQSVGTCAAVGSLSSVAGGRGG